MFDTAVESTYIWVGLTVVSAGLFGLALDLPTRPPPDAAPVARTIDSVASSPHEATANHPIDAEQIRLGAHRIGVRGSGGAAHATVAYGPVVPALGGDRVSGDGGTDRLRSVLRGVPPERAFATPDSFQRALNRSRTTDPSWQPAPETLTVRRVSWEGVNATLVG